MLVKDKIHFMLEPISYLFFSKCQKHPHFCNNGSWILFERNPQVLGKMPENATLVDDDLQNNHFDVFGIWRNKKCEFA